MKSESIIRSFFNSTSVRVVISVLPLLSGVFLLVFRTEITESWPAGGWPDDPVRFVPAAFIYWLSLVSTAALFLGRDVLKAKSEEESAENQSRLSAELQSALAEVAESQREQRKATETLPGPTFRGEFARKADRLQVHVAVALFTDPTGDELINMIRELVSDIASLASTYGPHDNGALYRAHVMTYVTDLSDESLVRLRIPDIENEGYLLLRPDLSATMEHEATEEVPVFALPVPAKNQIGTPTLGFNVIPGPQVAFVLGSYGGIPNVSEFKSAARRTSPAIVQALEEWTVSNPFEGSFVSFPLGAPKGKSERQNVGVVTIYTDIPNVIGGREERWNIFGMMMRPFFNGVATLLKRLEALQSEDSSS